VKIAVVARFVACLENGSKINDALFIVGNKRIMA